MTKRLVLHAVLLAAGIGLYAWAAPVRPSYTGEKSGFTPTVLTGIGLLCLLSAPLRGLARRVSVRFDALPPGRHLAFVTAFGLLIAGHLLYASARGGRYWVPQFHDEQMYLLQARQLASGHLAMPGLPFPEFFDSFYIFTTPVYASMYFPGTALAYVPAFWLNLPWVAWPLVIMTGAMLMTYAVAARLLGRLTGVVAVLCTLGTLPMNFLPTMAMSHPLGALLGLLMLYACLRWRDHAGYGWAVTFGVAAGWMAITRPLECLAFGLPAAALMLVRGRAIGWRRTLACGVVSAACTVPFLALQLAFNRQVTGSFLKLPISFYVEREFPKLGTMGKNPKPGDFETPSTLPQKQAIAKTFVPYQLTRHANESVATGLAWRTQEVLSEGLPASMFYLILPLSLSLALRHGVWAMLWAVPALFAGGYLFYGTYLSQYTIQIAPVLVVLALGGGLAVSEAFARATAAWGVRLGFVFAPSAAAIGVIATMPNNAPKPAEWDLLDRNYNEFPKTLKQPALLFIRFGRQSNPHMELVYNLESAWPDDARLIRLHDFGPQRDLPVLEYYAQRQPGRHVYRLDRETYTITDLGNVTALVAKLKQAATRPG